MKIPIIKDLPFFLKFTALLFLPFLITYGRIIYEQFQWSLQTENEWQLLIIPITLYMLFKRRDQIRSAAISSRNHSFPFALALYLFSLLLSIYGELTLSQSIVEISFFPFLIASTVVFYGFSTLRIIAWPISYLLLTTSLFIQIQSTITPTLQIAASTIAVNILNLLGFTSIQNGTYFRVPGGVLNVANACSGFNQLLTLAALSIPMAYIMLRKLSLQLLILFLAFPISILMNGIRISFIGIWNYSQIKPDLHGPYDVFYAPFIFLTGLILLFFITRKIAVFDIKSTKPQAKPCIENKLSLKIPVSLLIGYLVISFACNTFLHRTDKPIQRTDYLKTDTWKVNPVDYPFKFLHFTRSARMIAPDSELSLKCEKNGTTLYFYHASLSRQSSARNVKSFTLPSGRSEYKQFNLNDSTLITAEIRRVQQEDTGTVLMWYSDNKKLFSAKIEDIKKKNFKNSVGSGNTGGSITLCFMKESAIENDSIITNVRDLLSEIPYISD